MNQSLSLNPEGCFDSNAGQKKKSAVQESESQKNAYNHRQENTWTMDWTMIYERVIDGLKGRRVQDFFGQSK